MRDTINRHAELYNIKLYNFSINSNHLHLPLKLRYRDSYKKFIRGLTGTIARIALETKKGNAGINGLVKKFWDTRPFSKIVNWGRHYVNTYFYVFENELEAAGFIKYRERKQKPNKHKKITHQANTNLQSKMITRKQGRANEAYYQYVGMSDDEADKVSAWNANWHELLKYSPA
ncbi:MAG: transposase [Oligoflexia bacterium]|nr:transposase [Oligoflexia bacterium]